MADGNTTDSNSTTTTPTPEPTAPQPSAPTTPDTSTTPDPAPSDGDGTILTPPAEGENETTTTEQTEEQKAAEEARAALYGAPEGDYEITGLPEGMEVDKDALELVTPVAKELNLSNEGFNKLTAVYATEILPKVSEQVVAKLEGDIRETQTQWATEAEELIRTDPAFGGRPKTEITQVAAKALDKFGGTEFREFLQSTGLGNHPSMVKMAYLVGQAISEDSTFERGGPPEQTKTRVDKYYGKQS